jgi:hypothetical protein
MSQTTHNRFQLWGWTLFVLSAMCYIGSSIRAGDTLGLAGGTLFLLACLVFLVPLLPQLAQGAEVDSVSSSSQPSKYFRYLRGWFRAASSRWRAPGARTTPLMPAHLLEQSRRHSIRSELRFYASTR